MLQTTFHQPFWSTRSSTDTDGLHTVEPSVFYFLWSFDEVTVLIDAQTLVEEYSSVAALPPTDEEHEVMA